jgi:hypothetical protein
VLGGECGEAGDDVRGGCGGHVVILRRVSARGGAQVRTRIKEIGRIGADRTEVSST